MSLQCGGKQREKQTREEHVDSTQKKALFSPSVHSSPAPALHVLLCALAAEAGLCRADTAPSKVHHVCQP